MARWGFEAGTQTKGQKNELEPDSCQITIQAAEELTEGKQR
jgi:hypothetical protein